VAGVAGRRERHAAGPHAQPRITAVTRVRCGDAAKRGAGLVGVTMSGGPGMLT
jgi:hypothetical protein